MKQRKSRRKQGFPRRRAFKPKPNLTYLHSLEEAIIMRDIREITEGNSYVRISVDDLDRHAPMRYDRIMLGRALRRMKDQGQICRSGQVRSFRTGGRIVVYALPVYEQQRAAA